MFFFFNDTATTEIYTLSLHDALPISWGRGAGRTRCIRRSSGSSSGSRLARFLSVSIAHGPRSELCIGMPTVTSLRPHARMTGQEAPHERSAHALSIHRRGVPPDGRGRHPPRGQPDRTGNWGHRRPRADRLATTPCPRGLPRSDRRRRGSARLTCRAARHPPPTRGCRDLTDGLPPIALDMPGDTALCLRPRAAGLRQVAGPDRGTVIERV